MILSNEPGYYKTGEYGIRIENLVLVVDKPVDGRGKGDARLRDPDLRADRAAAGRRGDAQRPRSCNWLNDYHAEVLAKIGPRLEGDDKAWLERQCAPLSR